MKRRIICAVLVSVLLFSAIVFTGMKRLEAQGTPLVYVDPPSSIVSLGETFTIAIKVANVTDLYGYDLWVGYNDTILEVTGLTVVGPGQVVPPQPSNYSWLDVSVSGTVKVAVAFIEAQGAEPFNGNGTLLWIAFNGTAEGTSTIDISDAQTKLYDKIALQIPMDSPVDGSVTVAKPIKIGIMGPMGLIYGDGMKEGAIMAKEEIGTILERPIQLIYADEFQGGPDGTNETGTLAMQALMAAGCDFVIGGFRSESVFGAREVACDYQTIYLTTGASTDNIIDCDSGTCGACVRCDYERYKYVFRIMPVNSTTLVSCLLGIYYRGRLGFMQYVLSQLKEIYGSPVPYAAVVENLTWASGLAYVLGNVSMVLLGYPNVFPYNETGLADLYLGSPNSVKVGLAPGDAKLAGWTGTYPSGQCYLVSPNATDMDAILTQIQNGPDGNPNSGDEARIILTSLSAEQAGRAFINSWKKLNVTAIPFGINAIDQIFETWNETAGAVEYETLLAPTGTRTPITNLSIPFWDAYLARWGRPPIYTAYSTYNAMYTLAEAITRANSTDADAVIPELEKTDRLTPLGKFKFTGPNPGNNGNYTDYDSATPGDQPYPYNASNPTMMGTLHDVYSVSYGANWTDGYARPFICQWQAGKLEVIWPADQPYSKELALSPLMEPIKIGVLGPMAWIQGQGIKEGAILAAEEINATGGILGHPVEIIFADTLRGQQQPNAITGIAAAEELMAAGVDFVIGGINSEAVFGAREVFMDNKTIYFIAGASTNQLVDDPDTVTYPDTVRGNYTRYKYLFRVSPANGTTIVLSLWGFHRFVLEEKLLPLYGELLWPGAPNPQVKVAVVTENSTWADTLHLYYTEPALYSQPFCLGPYANVTYVARPAANETNFESILQSIKDSGARLIIHTFSEEAGRIFITQWKDMEVEAVPVGINIHSLQSDTWNLTGGNCEYETLLASSGTRTPVTNLSIPFWDAYVARWGHDPFYTSSWTAYEAIIRLDEMFEANFASMPDLSNQTVYDNLIPLIEQTDRIGTLGRFRYTGPNPSLNSTNYPFYSTNPNFTGTLHDFFSNEIGPTWTQGYSRPFIVQWQAGKLEVIWPADQSYSKEFELPLARVSVVPSTDVAVAGQSFTVNITVSNAVDLYLWAFSISWNPATLDLIDVTEGDFLTQGGSTTGVLIKEINQTGGYMSEATCSLLGDIPGVNGSGTLATLTFKATAVGSSPLDIYFCDLLNSTGESISRLVTDSSVDIDAPDLSISNVSLPYPDLSLYVNTTVSVNVTIQNTGNFSATAFNVSLTAYWDEGEIVDYFGKLTVESLEPNTTLTLQFNFTLHYTGNYTLTFKVDYDNDVIEVNETNNELILTIKVKMQGDIDGDDEVTYLDLFDLSRAYWSTPEDTNWDPYADINNDGKVDYNDLFLLAQNYSE